MQSLLRREMNTMYVIYGLIPFILLLFNVLLLFIWYMHECSSLFSGGGLVFTVKPMTSIMFILLSIGIIKKRAIFFYSLTIVPIVLWSLTLFDAHLVDYLSSITTTIVFIIFSTLFTNNTNKNKKIYTIWGILLGLYLAHICRPDRIPNWIGGTSIVTTIFFILSTIWVKDMTFVPLYPIANAFNFKSFPMLIVSFDMNTYKFLKVSESSKALLGYDPKEMEGKSFTEFIYDGNVEESIDFIETNKEDDYPPDETMTNYYRHKNGKPVKLIWFVDETTTDAKNISFGYAMK